jgi:hypothetical protein
MDDRARDRAEERAGYGAETARANHDQRGVAVASELDDSISRASFEDLLLRVDPLLDDELAGTIESHARLRHLLAQLFLVVGDAKRPEGRPNVDEDGRRPERARYPRSRDDRLVGPLGAVSRDDDRFSVAMRMLHRADRTPVHAVRAGSENVDLGTCRRALRMFDLLHDW